MGATRVSKYVSVHVKKIAPPLLYAARATLISLIVLKYHKCVQWIESCFIISQVCTMDGVFSLKSAYNGWSLFLKISQAHLIDF